MSDDPKATPNPADTNPAATPAAPVVTPPAAAGETDPAKVPLHKGLIGEITDPQELAKYTKTLEEKLVETTLAAQARTQISGEPPVTPPPAKKAIEEEIEDELFTNPKVALKKYRDSILNEVNQQNARQDQVKQFWNDFYDENTDLKGLDSIVKMVEAKHSAELRPLSISAARKKLADEVRKTVKLIEAKRGVTTEELPNGGATILGSGGAGQGAAVKTPGKILNFADEMRQFQRAKGRKA